MSAAKVPATPPASFRTLPDHLREYWGTGPGDGLLHRIYRTAGAHPVAWDELREWGPVPGMRFDPQPPPTKTHSGIGVMYAATDALTCLAEVYQSRRVIRRSEGGATLVAWKPTRPLLLLDLTTNWPILNGASAALMMGSKRYTQRWANAIWTQHGSDIDGIYSLSSLTSRPMITLFSRAKALPSFPSLVEFNAPLTDSSLNMLMVDAFERLGYKVER